MTCEVISTFFPTTSTNFNMDAEHNGIQCILNEQAERPCDRAWFTAKQIEEWSGMTKGTLRNRLIDLEECERIQSGQDFNQIKIPDDNGRGHETTIYNLRVLNQLAMVEMKNKVLNETSKKFDDILSEVEMTGTYLSAEDKLILSCVKSESMEARLVAVTQFRDLKDAQIKVIAEQRDQAIQDRNKINAGRTASAMGKLGATVRTCNNLKVENGVLKREWYSNSDTRAIIREKGLTTYAESVLKKKTSKALKAISSELELPVREEIVNRNGKDVPKPYYFRTVVETLLDRLTDNPKYLVPFN